MLVEERFDHGNEDADIDDDGSGGGDGDDTWQIAQDWLNVSTSLTIHFQKGADVLGQT